MRYLPPLTPGSIGRPSSRCQSRSARPRSRAKAPIPWRTSARRSGSSACRPPPLTTMPPDAGRSRRKGSVDENADDIVAARQFQQDIARRGAMAIKVADDDDQVIMMRDAGHALKADVQRGGRWVAPKNPAFSRPFCAAILPASVITASRLRCGRTSPIVAVVETRNRRRDRRNRGCARRTASPPGAAVTDFI